MVVYQLYQFIKKAFYINTFLILKLSVSAVFGFRSTVSILTPNQADGIKPSFLVALFTKLQTSSNLKSHHLASRLTLPLQASSVSIKSNVNRKTTNVYFCTCFSSSSISICISISISTGKRKSGQKP